MNGWRKTVTRERLAVFAVAASLSGLFGSTLCATARETQPERLVEYVPPSLLSRPATPTVRKPPDEMRALDEGIVAAPPIRPQTSGDRWLEFEREYGIQHRSHSRFLSMLQSAKYGLDKMSFAAKETARRLEFTYDIGSPTGPAGETPKPQYSLPLFGTFGHPQVKSVLTEHDPQTGSPFVGLKLSIPFGESE